MIRDINGIELPVGKTIKTIKENFVGYDGLPTWLTVTGTGVTSSIEGVADSFGYLQINTSAVTNNTVRLNILPSGVDMSEFEEIRIKFESLYAELGWGSCQMFVGLGGVDCGFTFKDLNKIDLKHSSGVTTTKTLSTFQHDQTRKSNIEFRIRKSGKILIMISDTVAYEYDSLATELTVDGDYFPSVVFKTLSDNARWLRISSVEVTLIHN